MCGAHLLQVSSEQWQQTEQGEVTLRTWDLESSHNYENNQHNNQVRAHRATSTYTYEHECELVYVREVHVHICARVLVRVGQSFIAPVEHSQTTHTCNVHTIL